MFLYFQKIVHLQKKLLQETQKRAMNQKGRSCIAIRELKLWGFHGCLTEERKVGTEYVVDLYYTIDTTRCEDSDSLADTVNYVEIQNIIKEIFQEPVNLIEHLGRKILNSITATFPQIDTVRIVIKKKNPPINNFDGYVEVSINHPR